eukprot:jgi/Botrbrau1/21275/Bobra.39_2s0064.1
MYVGIKAWCAKILIFASNLGPAERTTVEVVCSRKVKLVADDLITNLKNVDYDLIALPGGMPGAERLRDSAPLTKILEKQVAAKPLLDSHLCIASCRLREQGPGLLARRPLLILPSATSWPTPVMCHRGGCGWEADHKPRVPGQPLSLLLTLVDRLYGSQAAQDVAGPMVMYDYKPAKDVEEVVAA